MAKLTLFPAEVRSTAQNFAFPLVDKVLDEELALSRRYVPVRKPKPFDRRPTGRLKRSLRKHGPRKLITKVQGSVGSRAKYAASVHDGAQSHTFTAKNKKVLRFWWEKKGVVFFGPKVNHPGVSRSSRKQFLYLPLVIVGRRNGFIVRRLTGDIASKLP